MPVTSAPVVGSPNRIGGMPPGYATCGLMTVVAIDSDPDALQSAAENIVLNDVGDRVELRLVDLAWAAPIAGAPFDLLLANLTGGLLMRQSSTLTGLVARGGALIVGGIEAHESDQITAAFGAVGCSVLGHDDEQGWAGFILRCRAASDTSS